MTNTTSKNSYYRIEYYITPNNYFALPDRVLPRIIILLLSLIENAKTKTINEPPVQYSKLSTGKSKGSLDLSTEKELKVTKNGFSVFPALVKTFGASFFLGAFMQITVAG